ncbi:MAG: FtsQ-type POTRA domain-containing protein [Gracilibacteraceae bacterium]|jgi:cell division protein FtsQ|nr:FtsQ-type POTRA domain-containing protein [Gracilibacteraceae bacterium]
MSRKKKLSPLGRAALLCVLMLCFFLFAGSQFFAVKAVRTEGLVRLRESDVLRLAGIEPGDNLFLVEAAALARKVELNPLVAKVRVKKNFPGALVISVTEREPAALILKADGSGAIEVDDEGFILRIYESWPSGGLPVVTGLEPETIPGPGKQIISARLNLVLATVRLTPPDIMPLVGEININEIGQIKFFLTSGVEIRFGKAAPLEKDFLLLRELIQGEEFRAVASTLKYIDLSSSKPALGQ